MPELVDMRGVSKSFPGVRALDRVDFTLRRGEVHALLGQNGAGKSTLVKILNGVHRPDAGRVLLDGRPFAARTPLEAQKLGVSTVFQEIDLLPQLSIAENIVIGRAPRRLGLIDWPAARRRARAALARLDLDLDVRAPLGAHSIAVQQMVAIARALSREARVLILDEPTSSLDAGEVGTLFAVLRRLRDGGMGIVFISHFLDEVCTISDRLTVLRNGRRAGEHEPDVPRHELIAEMLGRPVETMGAHPAAPAPTPVAEAPRLAARNLTRRGAVEHVDLELRGGRVLGLGGLLGSGRTETARLLFGIDRADAGRIEVDGRPVARLTPRRAVRRGIAFAPEDRRSEGIIAALSVRENIVLALQARRGWRRLAPPAQRRLCAKLIEALGISMADAEQPAGQLSGGNQQKVILARWLATEPRALILDEPTRGIDVGAKAQIEALVARLCADGLAVLFISGDLEEVARDSHSVVVLRDRRMVGRLDGDDVTVRNIVSLIAADGAGPRHA